MKKIIAIATGLLIIAGAIYGQAKSPRPYKFKSGIIEYKYSGDKTGTSTLYFDDYGMKSAMYSGLTIMGKTTQTRGKKKGNVEYSWKVEEGTKSGVKMEDSFMSWLEDNPNGNMASYLEETYKKMGIVKSGTEKFLEKECTLFKGNNGKVLIWEGIIMLKEFKTGADVSRQEATSVQTNVPVDPKYFDIPEDITFTDKSGS
jgi:hypothetical protein